MNNLEIEKKYFQQGYEKIIGVDEAGRGCLAGPVVAASVAIAKNEKIDIDLFEEVKDSKKLSAKKREELFEIILNNIKEVKVALCSNREIDKINILNASLFAMKRAVDKISEEKDLVLVDGNKRIPNITRTQITVVKGDSKVFSIAAASIIAKVSRDKIMKEYAKKYPEYMFEKHKAYGTKVHLEKLKEFGPCPIHRFSFAPVKELL